MEVRTAVGARVREFIHQHFLWLLVGSYVLAAFWPAPGTLIRHMTLTFITSTCTLPLVLLTVLLFNAGLVANVAELKQVVRRPGAVVVGVAASIVVPLGVLSILAASLAGWHNPGEVRALVVGLGVVAAMPIAGSSTTWSQNAGGSTALSLGLVLMSTALSPLTTPLALATVIPLAGGGRESFAGLVGPETWGILLAGVALPSLLGMAGGRALGRYRIAGLRPSLKLANEVVLLVLCYANATSALPAVAAEPDWDYLALVLAGAVTLCSAGFATGWAVSRLVRAGDTSTRSLVFGLGMTNNGTGLVIAGSALVGMPEAAVPVLTYNLVQHVLAGVASRTLGRP